MNPSQQDVDQLDRQFCLDQVLKVRPYFRLSHPYARPQYSAQILVINAWLSAIEESCSMVSDEVVTRTKLSWWHQVLFEDESQNSNHPIVRQMLRMNLMTTEHRVCYQRILGSALEDMDRTAPLNETELKSRCQRIGENQMMLEVNASSVPPADMPILTSLCAINGLLQVLRESNRKKLNPYHWIPLNLLARLGMTRNELESSRSSNKIDLLVSEISALSIEWINELGSQGKFSALMSDLQYEWRTRHLHFLVLTALNMRCLRRLHKQGQGHRSRILNRPGPADALFAWRLARKLT